MASSFLLIYFKPAKDFFGDATVSGNVYRAYDTDTEQMTTFLPSQQNTLSKEGFVTQDVEYGNFMLRNSMKRLHNHESTACEEIAAKVRTLLV